MRHPGMTLFTCCKIYSEYRVYMCCISLSIFGKLYRQWFIDLWQIFFFFFPPTILTPFVEITTVFFFPGSYFIILHRNLPATPTLCQTEPWGFWHASIQVQIYRLEKTDCTGFYSSHALWGNVKLLEQFWSMLLLCLYAKILRKRFFLYSKSCLNEKWNCDYMTFLRFYLTHDAVNNMYGGPEVQITKTNHSTQKNIKNHD